MKSIFLESHHIKNLNFGFGQFNYHLIKGLHKIKDPELDLVLHAKDTGTLKAEFGNSFKYKKYYSLRRYPAFRIRQKYDLWHAMNQNTKIEPYHDLPYLLTVHDHPNIKDPDSYKHLEPHVKFQEKLSRSTVITYISEFTKNSTKQFFDVPNVPEYVIYNGNPVTGTTVPEGFMPRYVPKKPFLFTIGVVQPRKSFINLVRMMPLLCDYELIIAGSNTTKAAEEIRDLIKSERLDNRVILTGEISDTEKLYYYRNCQAFMFPSVREGFGFPVIEAMRFGKPVFLSDKSCLPEIGGEAANYWTNTDAGYMASVVNKGIEDHYNHEQERSNKLIMRSQDFNWDTAAAEYHKVYRSLL